MISEELKPPKKKGEGVEERIVAPGEMLIFSSGHYPILGTQILYFKDPVLSQRVAIPPPTQFHTIASGKIVPQPAAGRTANVVSRAEHPPAASEDRNGDSDSDASPMAGFHGCVGRGRVAASRTPGFHRPT